MKVQVQKAVIIGATGKQGLEYTRLLHEDINIVGIVDTDKTTAQDLSVVLGIPAFGSTDEALHNLDFDLALLAVPHYLHHSLTVDLVTHKKHVIKEKPLALTKRQALELQTLAEENDVSVFTIVQRNHHDMFLAAYQALGKLGTAYEFTYQYSMNFAKPTSGWRAVREMSGGGVLIDMGYHIIDMINKFFGVPDQVYARFSYCFGEMARESLEDSANMILSYSDQNLQGQVHLARHHYEKVERFEILGTNGALVITPGGYKLCSLGGEVVEASTLQAEKMHDTAAMFRTYLSNLGNRTFRNHHISSHVDVVGIVEKVYEAAGITSADIVETGQR